MRFLTCEKSAKKPAKEVRMRLLRAARRNARYQWGVWGMQIYCKNLHESEYIQRVYAVEYMQELLHSSSTPRRVRRIQLNPPMGGATAALPNVAMQFEEGHSVRSRFLQNCAES